MSNPPISPSADAGIHAPEPIDTDSPVPLPNPQDVNCSPQVAEKQPLHEKVKKELAFHTLEDDGKRLTAEFEEFGLESDIDDDNSIVSEDLEAGGPLSPTSSNECVGYSGCGGCASEEAVGAMTVTFWLLFWFCNNIGLTLVNKAIFAKFDFKYPFFLSFFHMICNFLGGEVTMALARKRNGGYRPVSIEDGSDADGGGLVAKRPRSLVLDGLERSNLDRNGQLKMWAFSVIFSMNIAIGNVSLRYVSVNFNQVMRSLVPAAAILFGACIGRKTSWSKIFSVIPVIMGVAMACYGEMELMVVGVVFTTICVLLAALKAVAAGEILTGDLKVHPVDLLNKMAPKAAIQCLLLSFFTGELSSIASRWHLELNPVVDYHPTFGVVFTGILSFSLNISSLMMNKLTSPLTLCIAANVKQIFMIGMATVIFETPITLLNGAGILVVLIGSAIYSYVSLREKQENKSAESLKHPEKVLECADTVKSDVSDEEEEVDGKSENVALIGVSTV